MKAFVLAAGLGTRLRPLTLSRAKPALPVVGVPMLWFGAWHLKKSVPGLAAFAVNAGHAKESLVKAARDPALARFAEIDFHVSDESAGILGSSGALWKLREWMGGDRLAVVNGDSIGFPSWGKMLELHQSRRALVTVHVRGFKNASEPYATWDVAADGRVLAIGGKEDSGVMFSGSYLIEPEAVGRLPSGASELRPALLEPLLAEGRLYAFREDIPWSDAGAIDGYVDLQFTLLQRFPAARGLVESRMREIAQRVWVPRAWVSAGAAYRAPVVMMGEQHDWEGRSRMYGPRFVGIEPPPPGTPFPFRDALVFSGHVLEG